MLRIKYFIAFIILMVIECYIAISVHDSFIRPYVGDILVVFVLYCFIRAVIPCRWKLLPVYIFLFAVSIELLQYFKLAEQLGLEKNSLMGIIIGSVFDIKDIVCYGIGCTLLAGCERRMRRYKENH